ncbi:hypothetical protein DMUE_1705 [Dictyocoela muelleri]|nr:hypothetical protein DMUE_1705 [Dictyocoela muelleri]
MKLLEKLLLGTTLHSEEGKFPENFITCLRKHCTAECIANKQNEWEFFALFLANKGTKKELIANLKNLHNDLRIAIYQKCVPSNRYLKFNEVFDELHTEVAEYIVKSCYDVGDNDVIFNIYMNIVEDLKENIQVARNVIKRRESTKLLLNDDQELKDSFMSVIKTTDIKNKKLLKPENKNLKNFENIDTCLIDYKIIIPAIKNLYSLSYDHNVTYKLIYILVFENKLFCSYNGFYKLFISYLVRKNTFFKFLDVLFATNCTAIKLFAMIVEEIWGVGSKEYEYIFYDQFRDTVELENSNNVNVKGMNEKSMDEKSINLNDDNKSTVIEKFEDNKLNEYKNKKGSKINNTINNVNTNDNVIYDNVNHDNVNNNYDNYNHNNYDNNNHNNNNTNKDSKPSRLQIIENNEQKLSNSSLNRTKLSLNNTINSTIKKIPDKEKIKKNLFTMIDKLLTFIDLSLLSRTEKIISLLKPETPKISRKTRETFFDFLIIQNKSIEAQVNIKNGLLNEIYSLRNEISNLRNQNKNLKIQNQNFEDEMNNFQNEILKKLKKMIEIEKNDNERLKKEIEILKSKEIEK